MRRLSITCLALACSSGLLLPPAAGAAPAASATASKPTISRVTPMRIGVGALLTVRGRNFKATRTKNTLIFRGPDGRSAFAKPRRATRTKLVVAVPPAVARLLSKSAGVSRATRFELRVLAGRFSKFTVRRLSPVVVPAGSGAAPGGGAPGAGALGGGAPSAGIPALGVVTPAPGGGPGATGCPAGDGDLLSNADEAQIKTDPCLADTDGDGVEDGYEWQSAVDLNHYPGTTPLPYPGKRPFPNPLDPSDGAVNGTDYDGDGLVLREEFQLWLTYSADGVRRPAHPGTPLAPLVYSDGLQKSVSPPSAGPAGSLRAWALDIRPNGTLDDDERDGDADGLANWDEVHGRMTEGWWPAQHDGVIEPKESAYPNLDFLDNQDTGPDYNAHIDPDMDGDGVLDGDDDNDHDGLTNQFEVHRPGDWQADAINAPRANTWAYTNPFNPCKPYNSERCHLHPPFGYYASDGVPPIGPDPPAGYPAAHPTTPDG